MNPEGSRIIAVSFGQQTKTSYTTTETGDIQPVFANGDEILVANGEDEPETCVVSVDDKTKIATISTNLAGTLKAVYPAKAARMDEQNPKAIGGVLVSTEQDGTFASANICMVKNIPEDAKEVTFQNKTAVFRIIPAAGKNAQYVEVSAEGFEIANDFEDESVYQSGDVIHVAPITADTVYVSTRVPDGLTIGNLKFSDGTNVKAITTGDRAAESIVAGTLYTVDNENWESTAPEPEVEYVVMNMGTGESAYTRKWAKMNLGATTVAGSYETCAGDYYAWGETDTYYGSLSWSGKTGTFSDWKSGKTDGYCWQSYCGQSSYTEWTQPPYDSGKKNLTDAYDVAKQKLGNGWRMPTKDEFQDLYDACGGTDTPKSGGSTSTTTKGVYWCSSYDGVAGLLFCDEAGHKLFFPAAGYGYNTSLDNAGSCGRYWSSTLYTDYPNYAYILCFSSDYVYPNYYNRFFGFSVRPVYDDSTPAGPTVEYVEIAADYDNDPLTPDNKLKWCKQNLSITASGKKAWKGKNSSAVKVPGTNEDVIVGDYFQWAASYDGYNVTENREPDSLLVYTAFTNKGCGDDEDKFTFRAGKNFEIANAPYYSGSAYSKYNDDDKTTRPNLEPSDDVASIILGDTWRMPTSAEFQAMKAATYWAWDVYDCGYYVFTPEGIYTAGTIESSIPTGLNKFDALMFFPVAGRGYGTSLISAGSYGIYWSSSLYTSDPNNAYRLYFDSSDVSPQNKYTRYSGLSVRPVSD